MQRTFHEEGPADEAVRRADEAHDGDFLAACEDSQANRVVDEHKRDEDEQHDERDTDIADVGRQLEELCDRLLTIFKRLGRRIVAADGSKRGVLLDLARHILDELRVRSAWSFVVKSTDATPSMPRMKSSTLSMSDCEASSEMNAEMPTSFSTDDMTLFTTTPPTRKMPMMSSERKIVTMEPKVVERLRVNPCSDSLKK